MVTWAVGKSFFTAAAMTWEALWRMTSSPSGVDSYTGSMEPPASDTGRETSSNPGSPLQATTCLSFFLLRA